MPTPESVTLGRIVDTVWLLFGEIAANTFHYSNVMINGPPLTHALPNEAYNSFDVVPLIGLLPAPLRSSSGWI